MAGQAGRRRIWAVRGKSGERGIAQVYCLGPPVYGSPVFPPGEYRLQVLRSPEAFALSAAAVIALHADEPNRISLRSPGFGGRVRVVAEKDADAEPDPQGLRVVFRPVSSGPDERPPELRVYLTGRGFDGDLAAILLEPGTWSWELRRRDRSIVERGISEARPREETRLVFRVHP